MIDLVRKYKRWNTFERIYFWTGITIVTIGVTFSISVLSNNMISIIARLGMVSGAIAILAYYQNVIYRSLSEQERVLKNIIVDPITNEEIKI